VGIAVLGMHAVLLVVVVVVVVLLWLSIEAHRQLTTEEARWWKWW
jgi:hypothetical protein